MSPPLSVQLTVTFTAPLTSPERSSQERMGVEGGPGEMNEPYLNNLTATSTLATIIVHITANFININHHAPSKHMQNPSLKCTTFGVAMQSKYTTE